MFISFSGSPTQLLYYSLIKMKSPSSSNVPFWRTCLMCGSIVFQFITLICYCVAGFAMALSDPRGDAESNFMIVIAVSSCALVSSIISSVLLCIGFDTRKERCALIMLIVYLSLLACSCVLIIVACLQHDFTYRGDKEARREDNHMAHVMNTFAAIAGASIFAIMGSCSFGCALCCAQRRERVTAILIPDFESGDQSHHQIYSEIKTLELDD